MRTLALTVEILSFVYRLRNIRRDDNPSVGEDVRMLPPIKTNPHVQDAKLARH
jgi:hypothetical protein